MRKIFFLITVLVIFSFIVSPSFAAQIVNGTLKVTEQKVSIQAVTNDTGIILEVYDGQQKRVAGPTITNGATPITASIDVSKLIRGISYTLKGKDKDPNSDGDSFDIIFTTVKENTQTSTSGGNFYYTTSDNLYRYDTNRSQSFYQFKTLALCNTSQINKINELRQAESAGGGGYSAVSITNCFESRTIPTKQDFSSRMQAIDTFTGTKDLYYFTYKSGSGDMFNRSKGYTTEAECKQFEAIYSGSLLQPCMKSSTPPTKPPASDTDYHLISPQADTPVYKKTYRLLAPIGDLTCIENGEGVSNPGCVTGNVGTYLNIIFRIAIGLAAALAVVMIVVYSIAYMGNESVFGKNEAKSNILSSIGGLLIALGAYALLASINPDLVGTSGATIDQVEAQVSPDQPQAVGNGGKYVGTNYVKGQNWPSDSVERSKLLSLGITTATPICTTVGQSGCATVFQLDTAFVSKLKNNCKNCDIVITEGTGFWKHAASTKKIHYPGGWTVDLRKTTTLTNYVHSLPKVYKAKWFKGAGANCYSTRDGLGIIEESNHFHAFSLTGQCDGNKQGI